MESTKFIWLDGEMLPWDDAKVPVMSYGLHYGLGVFEGLRCHETPRGPAIFRLADHVERLARSAGLYLIKPPYSRDELMEACRQTVLRNGVTDCYVRMILHTGFGASPLDSPVHTAIASAPVEYSHGPQAAGTGVRAKVSSYQKVSSNAIPPEAKATGQYLNSVLAKVDAMTSGYDECLLLNERGTVAEGSAQNVFAVREGELVTPPTTAGLLAGLTRHTVVVLARRLGYEVREAELLRTDLHFADEVFLTGTMSGIVPVVEVDARPVAGGTPGPVTQAIQTAYGSLVRGGIDDLSHWLHPLEEW
jgi:branched-chain amino acid aminotransferase